ncbi:MAG: hypothetical protein EA349_09430 [Halomonadaceae bacterium]|nr:MAG: hypothetical protein EA349_09430 [Halomonadaceae bacterium]
MSASENTPAPEGAGDLDTMTGEGQWCLSMGLLPGQTLANEMNGLRLWVTMLEKEWQLRHQRVAGDGEDTVWRQGQSFVVPDQDKTLQRFLRNGEADQLSFRPALADRSMVLRPYNALHIAPDSDCTIYMSTVLWVQVLVGEKQRLLTEMPIMAPSWTWMGIGTMEGEICYAGQSFARLMREALPKRPWRAITPVKIRNRGPETLKLDRLSLPVPLLALYQQQAMTSGEKGEKGGNGEAGFGLWTPQVTMTCEKNLATASLELGQGAPAEAGPCKLVAEAREKPDKGSLVRHIDRLFG